MERHWEDYAALPELLLDRRVRDTGRWPAIILLRLIETGGLCRYRHDRLVDASAEALEALYDLVAALTGPDQRLAVRVLLLVPWEMVRRSTGLTLKVAGVVEMLRSSASDPRCLAGVADVLARGPAAVGEFPTEGVLLSERLPGTGQVLTLPDGRRYELDRLVTALRNCRFDRCEANLRALLPWWLDHAAPAVSERWLRSKLDCDLKAGNADAAMYQLLGLLDWLLIRPSRSEVEPVLDLAVRHRDGGVRKRAVDLAGATNRLDLLARLEVDDPNVAVRKRAAEVLASTRSVA